LVIPPPFVAKNVIVFIGDGMGLEHVKAGSMYAYGATGEMPFEHFPYHALMRTGSNNGLTDSAAAATAMATGHKVDNKVISLAIPGNGRGYSTVLEYASKHEMSTGLVTTTPITNATPASFGAHAESREHYAKIAQDYLEVSRPNVLFGGGSSDITEERASAAGYQVITNRDEMLALDTETQTRVSGQFGAGYIPYESSGLGDQPHLSEMTAVALRILDNDPDGFFVMIEGGRIDTAAHDNDAEAMVGEMAEFGRSVQAAMDWAQGRDDTLIIVLADHETGGLQVVQNNGQGVVPDLSWSTSGHTGVDVGMWAYGKPLSGLSERIDNTEIPRIITAGEFYNR
jgi:alkaline phosphatase